MQQHKVSGAAAGVTEAGSVGAIVGAVIALGASRMQVEPWRPYGSFVLHPGGLTSAAMIGVPIVAWLGGRLANAATRGSWKDALVRAVWMAVLAVVLGSVATVLVVVVLELPGSNVGWEALILLPCLVAAPIVGMVVAGPLAIAVTLLAAIAWVVVLRMLVRPVSPSGEPAAHGEPRTREARDQAARQGDSPCDRRRSPAAESGRAGAGTASGRA